MNDTAQAYAAMGLRVFPLAPRTKVPAIPKEEGGQGYRDATTDEAQIQAWWARWPDANIGIAVPDEIVILDVDPRNGGKLEALGEIPETVIARTGGGGWHVWFRLPDGAQIRGKTGLAGVDVRKAGNYVVAPPSVHESGERYTWEPEHAIYHLDPAPIPAHLLALLVVPPASTRKALPTETSGKAVLGAARVWLGRALDKAQAGSRNDTGFWLATQMRDDGLAEDEAEPAMLDYASQVRDLGDHPYTDDEALASLRQAYNQGAREPARRTSDPHSSPPAGGYTRRGSSASASKAEGMRDSGERSDHQGATRPLRRSDNEAEGIPSFTSFILSQKTESKPDDGDDLLTLAIPDATRREMMRRMQAADTMPAGGVVQHPGSEAQKRRRKQYEILRAAWAYVFPGDTLISFTEMSQALNMVEQGMEGEMVLDQMYNFADAPRDKQLNAPRAAFMKALYNAMHPEQVAKRRDLAAQAQPPRGSYRSKQAKQQDGTAQGEEPSKSDEHGGARWAALKARAKAAGLGTSWIPPEWSIEQAEDYIANYEREDALWER